MSVLRYNDTAYRVGAVGKQVTTGAASANTTLPTDAAGNNPRFVRIAATGQGWIKFTKGASTATTNDILIVGLYPEIYDVKGFDTINYLQQGAAQVISITPLET